MWYRCVCGGAACVLSRIARKGSHAELIRLLPRRVHLEGWDLAAACVQQHMSAVGVSLGGPSEEGREQTQGTAGADAAGDSRRDEEAGHTATEQRLVQLDAPQMRLVIVANDLSREGGV